MISSMLGLVGVATAGGADQEEISKLQQAYFEMSVTMKLGQIIVGGDESIWMLETRRKGVL